MAYKAPIWEDGKSPAISAENLNNLSQAAEGAQVLCGNSAPTSSTEGAVGQFYLVVVADSDGSYPLYQCVASANGSYVWRDTRRIPDSITSMLGIPAPGTINSALNVLAHVGNLHVWERVQTYSEPVPEVPAGYTLGAVEENVSITNTTSSADTIVMYIATSLTVYNDGTISTSGFGSASGKITSVIDKMYGKFIYFRAQDSDFDSNNIIFIPSDATRSWGDNGEVVVSKLQRVTGYPYTPAIPAGTTTDYLTSTDRNAYPDQSAEGGQDAYYTLGDVVSNVSFGSDGNTYIHYDVSDGVVVDKSGNVTLGNTTRVVIGYGYNYTTDTVKSALAGKFIKVYANEYSDSSDTHTFIPNNTIVYIPSDVSITQDGLGPKHFIASYQPVTGHAAIPANHTITYLGQLGGGTRIEEGSYVGTGTHGSSNPNSLTFGFEPKMVMIFAADISRNAKMIINESGVSVVVQTSSNSVLAGFASITKTEKTITWYSTETNSVNPAAAQLNTSGITYDYIAIG